MRSVSRVGRSLIVAALCGTAATCDSVAENVIPSPSAPTVVSVEISGPSTVAPGQSAQFNALVRLSNGTSKLAASPTVRWFSSSAALQVNAAGLVTASPQGGEGFLTAEVPAVPASGTRRSTKEVVVLPDGTYRVVGLVSDADFPGIPVVGALVEVVGGVATTTGSDGRYRLYGVPGEADVQVSKAGYQPAMQSLRLTTNATQNFLLAIPGGVRPDLAGSYTLAIDVVACPGSRPLSQDLQHRSYDAVLTQNGAVVDVTLTEPRFRLNSINRGNRFSGRVDPAGATFTLEGFNDYYYGYYGPGAYPNVAERLSNGTFLVVAGTAVTIGSRAGLSGTMNGVLNNWDSRFPTSQFFLAGCSSSVHRFTLTPR